MAARKGYQVYGIDGSKSALMFSRNQFVQDGLTGEVRPILTTRVREFQKVYYATTFNSTSKATLVSH